MAEKQLHINEIFLSIQGESSWSGLPCVFVRLRGCPLRCHYCDTSYAFEEGKCMPLDQIITQIQAFNCPLVEITGGEPLLQPHVHTLMERLSDLDFQVLLETSGQFPIGECDSRVHRIVDIKTPNSGAVGTFLDANYAQLCDMDEVKFVITCREDFDWSISMVRTHSLLARVKAVNFSPVMYQEGNKSIAGCEALPPHKLADWILDSGEKIRLHLQLHRYVWEPDARGV